MAPKKQAVFFFALECREKRHMKGSVRDVLEAVYPEWQAMTPTQRAPYERQAAEQRELEKRTSQKQTYVNTTTNTAAGGPESNYRSSLTSSLITSVTGSELSGQAKPRREDVRLYIEKMVEDLKSETGMTDKEALVSQPWYFIKFVTFCRCEVKMDEYDPYFVLAEVGLVEYSLLDGITAEYHSFIHPNKVPLGYLSRVLDSSKDVHKIPYGCSRNSQLVNGKTYTRIYAEIYDFVTRRTDQLPRLFTMAEDLEETQFGLQYLYDQAMRGDDEHRNMNLPELHTRLSDLEWLVVGLAETDLSFAQSGELLTKYSYDYSSGTRCEFHDEEGVICCAIGIVKRKAYLISDHLCPLHNIQVTPAHLPIETSTGTIVEDEMEEFKFKFRQASTGFGFRSYTSDLKNGRGPKQSRSNGGYEQPYDIRYPNVKQEDSASSVVSTATTSRLGSTLTSREPVADKFARMSQPSRDRDRDRDVATASESNFQDDDTASTVSQQTQQSTTTATTTTNPEWYSLPKMTYRGPSGPGMGAWAKPLRSSSERDDAVSETGSESTVTSIEPAAQAAAAAVVNKPTWYGRGLGRGRGIAKF